MLIVTGLELRDDVRLIKKYAYFCLSRYITNSTLNKSIINIKIIDEEDLECEEEQKELRESAAWMTYDGIVNEKKKFTVSLDRATINTLAKKQITKYKKILQNLGHELVHIKQYLSNEMFDYTDGETVRFLGQQYHYSSSKKDLDWDYWESPWELEAYGRSEGLYHMFLKKLKEEKKA